MSIFGSVRSYANKEDFQRKELIGNLSISDILIQPRIISTEGQTNNFELDRSYFFFSWKMGGDLSAHFGIGQNSLINHNMRLRRDSTDPTMIAGYDDIGFFEAYGQFDSRYGTVKAGVIPLRFGWEGNRRESEWVFPRTLFYGGEDTSYQTQNFGLRDYGISYFVSHNYFYTQAAIHNGENGPDKDGKIWHTGVVGWKNNSGIEAAISMSNGNYQSQSNTDPEFEYTYANMFVSFEYRRLSVLLEGFVGREQKSFEQTPGEELKKAFWNWHVDVGHPITKGLMGYARYEEYDPDSLVHGDRVFRYIVGLGLSNELQTSNLYLWAIKNREDGVSINDDQYLLVWKVRSLSIF